MLEDIGQNIKKNEVYFILNNYKSDLLLNLSIMSAYRR